MRKIKKPFVCLDRKLNSIGRIILEDNQKCEIAFSRPPYYSETWWNPERLLRFETLEEAIVEYQKRTENQVLDFTYNLELDWVEKAMGKDFSTVRR